MNEACELGSAVKPRRLERLGARAVSLLPNPSRLPQNSKYVLVFVEEILGEYKIAVKQALESAWCRRLRTH
jgi:hypothetical protein